MQESKKLKREKIIPQLCNANKFFLTKLQLFIDIQKQQFFLRYKLIIKKLYLDLRQTLAKYFPPIKFEDYLKSLLVSPYDIFQQFLLLVRLASQGLRHYLGILASLPVSLDSVDS